MPDEVCEEEEEGENGFLKRFRYLAKKRLHFWNRWRREYLTDLREYHKHGKRELAVELQVGDVVLVKEDNIKRNGWKMGKVEELVVGKDEVVRGAKLKVFSKGKPVYLSRPIQRLYPVEVGRGCKVYWMTRKQGKTMVRKCLQVLGEHQNVPLRLTQTGKLERCLTLSPSLRSRGGECVE